MSLVSLPFLVLGAVVLAALFPARGVSAEFADAATKVAIALLFFLYGARLSPQQARHGVRRWQLHALVLTTTFVIFPILGLIASESVGSLMTDDLHKGLLFLCLVPSTMQSSVLFTSIARGHVSAAVVSASLSNILGVVLTPLLAMLLFHTRGGLRVANTAIVEIFLQLLLPFALGQLARPWIAAVIARHATLLKVVERASILVMLYRAFSVGVVEGVWVSVDPWHFVLVVALVATLLAMVLVCTRVIGLLARLERGDAIVLMFCGSKKSLASGLPVALVLFPAPTVGLIMLPLVLFHQLQLIVCAAIASRFAKEPARRCDPRRHAERR
ncbi:bile acid:sodium symporter [Mycobacterium simiae]|uniref:Bile acid:sodium symporter n=1 Tax=Mycobacterium simiae TaxID=1784 RepID=A0A5B1BNX9_MYCSI|nr:bile acid:sodium symporter family protein [Mycobacterium simiae]KAA1248709.1 bile acid:sodium symporter [Mycobacterium simiae]